MSEIAGQTAAIITRLGDGNPYEWIQATRIAPDRFPVQDEFTAPAETG